MRRSLSSSARHRSLLDATQISSSQTSKPCERVGPLDGPRQRGHMRALAREVVALAVPDMLSLESLKHTTAFRQPLARPASRNARGRPPDVPIPHINASLPGPSSRAGVCPAILARSYLLRQWAEMPSLAGPKSRALLASFHGSTRELSVE